MLDTLNPFVHLPVAQSRLPEVDFDRLQFGRTFSDHMFLLEYKEGAWQQGRIEPWAGAASADHPSGAYFGLIRLLKKAMARPWHRALQNHYRLLAFW